jgi:GTP cyclohydrolase II
MSDYLKFVGSETTFNSRIWGELTVESVSFTPASDGDLVVYFNTPLNVDRPLVRIHSECVFAEIFDSDFCDCADQLYYALEDLKNSPGGILFYLRFDGRGAGLSAKVKATALEMSGMDTYDSRVEIGVAPEGRNFENIAQFLIAKGIRKITLLTNSPNKVNDLAKHGIDVETKSLIVSDANENVKKLYDTKSKRFGHKI